MMIEWRFVGAKFPTEESEEKKNGGWDLRVTGERL